MKIFAVVVNGDDTVRVVSTNVLKETPQFYIIERPSGLAWDDPRRTALDAFGWRSRQRKDEAHTTERAALSRYMALRQQDQASALSVAGKARKQIASVNELLMRLPDPTADILKSGPRA